ncbi:uncharacterized protein [Rutidosis leptorrhynchoides]|uniref:uncharacterized protein n=1 Tax=Rutidosis leptorrhynchoides TaxID=125765 RepID=UPI003A991152
MGFGDKWRQWIFSCLKLALILILVNGSPTKEFTLGRGIHQGDPLSSFLFILTTEGLNILTKAATEKELFKCVKIGNDKVNVSHLQYEDDTMFIGVDELNYVANKLNCQVGAFPFTYFGLPIGAKMNKLSSWYPVIDKINYRCLLEEELFL